MIGKYFRHLLLLVTTTTAITFLINKFLKIRFFLLNLICSCNMMFILLHYLHQKTTLLENQLEISKLFQKLVELPSSLLYILISLIWNLNENIIQQHPLDQKLSYNTPKICITIILSSRLNLIKFYSGRSWIKHQLSQPKNCLIFILLNILHQLLKSMNKI